MLTRPSIRLVTRRYVRENLLQCIGDPIQYVRRVVGSCVTTIINYGGLETWPSIVPRLYQALDSPDTNLLDGAFSALHKICEDSAPRLAADVTTQPLQFLIPKFIQFFGHESEVLRRYAVASLYHFVQLMPPALTMHIDTYLQGLFALATDADPTVRKCVCQALVGLLDSALEKLAPHMGALVQYMLQATVDADEAVSLEACEFWGAICDTQIAHEALAPVLPQLIPVLLKGMVSAAPWAAPAEPAPSLRPACTAARRASHPLPPPHPRRCRAELAPPAPTALDADPPADLLGR